jgi:hypothetical protein
MTFQEAMRHAATNPGAFEIFNRQGHRFTVTAIGEVTPRLGRAVSHLHVADLVDSEAWEVK